MGARAPPDAIRGASNKGRMESDRWRWWRSGGLSGFRGLERGLRPRPNGTPEWLRGGLGGTGGRGHRPLASPPLLPLPVAFELFFPQPGVEGRGELGQELVQHQA